MSDYIKREDAIRSIADHDEFKGERWIKEAWADYLIEDAKPADAAPVRHGRWFQDAIYYGEDGSPCIVDICTECGAYGYYADFNYCPNCGAKMDGGDTDA